MIGKNQRPLNFTDSQVQQLKWTNDTLRKLNRAGLVALGRIGHKALTDTEYGNAGYSFAMMGDRMMSALRVRRELLTAGREQPPLRIEVVFSGKCDACWENGPGTRTDDQEADWREALEQDPAHQLEIESLLELALRTEERASVRCESGHALPKEFFSGINRLKSAVLRQLRDLRETALKHEPKIVVIRSNNCSDCNQLLEPCHQPLETEDEEDEPTMP
jgi:hypothetical protein